MDVGEEEEANDALVLQQAVTEATKQGAGFSHVIDNPGDISEMLSDSEIEAGPEVKTKASRQVRSVVMESLDFEPERKPQARPNLPALRATLTKRRTRS